MRHTTIMAPNQVDRVVDMEVAAFSIPSYCILTFVYF